MEEYLKAVTDPKGQSGETYPDGTPKTNMEAYLDKYDEERAEARIGIKTEIILEYKL